MRDDEYLTLREAACRVGYSDPATLRQAALRGTLQARKIGRQWVTTTAWLQDYLTRRRTHQFDARAASLPRIPVES